MHTDEHEGINIEREKERNRLGLVRSHLFAHCGVMSFGRRSTYRFNEHFKGVQEQANWTTECVCVRAGERASKWMWACLQRRCQLYSTIDCNCIHSRWTGMVDFHIQQIFYRINITRTISPKWICNFVSVTLRCVSLFMFQLERNRLHLRHFDFFVLCVHVCEFGWPFQVLNTLKRLILICILHEPASQHRSIQQLSDDYMKSNIGTATQSLWAKWLVLCE